MIAISPASPSLAIKLILPLTLSVSLPIVISPSNLEFPLSTKMANGPLVVVPLWVGASAIYKPATTVTAVAPPSVTVKLSTYIPVTIA